MSFQAAPCEDQYRNFPQLNRSDVLELLKWKETQPHLPTITELEAIFFLHSCECDLEAAKKCMDTYFTVRTMCPEFFGNRDVFGADFLRSMEVIGITLLPGRTKKGYRVFLYKIIDSDPSKFDYDELMKQFHMIFDFWLAKDGICEGFIVILDMDGTKFSHIKKLKIFSLRKSMYYIQEALPIRLRGIHYINTPSFMDKILALLKPFLKKELLKAIHVHKSLHTLLDVHVSKSIMPDEYEGTAGKLSDILKGTLDPVLANERFFVEEETAKRCKEELRPGKPKTERDLFGYFFAFLAGK